METSGGGGRGGGDHRHRSRKATAEDLGLHNGAAIFGATAHHQQTLTHPIDAVDRPGNNTATNSSSSNPDPVSFAFAAASSPDLPSMTSPHSVAAAKTKLTSSSSSSSVRYRECLRNHAASEGRSVLDGCCEFMPAGEEGTIEALRCAACDCHRNFHRRESDRDPSPLASSGAAFRRGSSLSIAPLQLPALPAPPVLHHYQGHGGMSRPPPPYGSLSIVPPMTVAFAGGGTESSNEDLNLFGTTTPTGQGHGLHHQTSSGGAYFGSSSSKSSKRFRTKFTPEQKDRMMEFAEKIGWKIQRQFDDEVDRFCAEVGVKRQVFKVWMHNNKNATRSSDKQQETPTGDHEADHDHHGQEH